MADILENFDPFNRKARVYPVLLAAAAVIVNVLLLWPSSALVRLVPALVAIGVLYAAADVARQAGQRLETRLRERWDGLPAQRMLRLLGSANPVQTERCRETVERLTGRSLPTAEAERKDRTRADQEYDAALKELIPRVRGEDKDPHLHAENMTYNFWRNSLALKPAAQAVTVIAVVGDAVAATARYHRGSALLALLLSVLVLAWWTIAVRESAVRQAADTYAVRLYQALSRL